jgi:hypothetical protein
MQNYVFSDWAVEDGSFLRLNTITLGYTLPNSLMSRANISSLRFYVQGIMSLFGPIIPVLILRFLPEEERLLPRVWIIHHFPEADKWCLG